MGALPFGMKEGSIWMHQYWEVKVIKTIRSLWEWVSIPPHINYMARRERVGCYTRAREYSEGRRRLGRRQRDMLLMSYSVAVHFWRLQTMWHHATVPAVGQRWHEDTWGLQGIASHCDVVPTTLCLDIGGLYRSGSSQKWLNNFKMKHCTTIYHLRQTHPDAVVPRLSFRLQGLHPQSAANCPTAQTVAALDLISNDPHLKIATTGYCTQVLKIFG